MYDPKIHHRHSIRLPGYDYSQACVCFVTICTQNRQMRFGNIVDGKMKLNDTGRIVQDIWHQIPVHFLAVTTDEFVVMPNHIHGIIITGSYGNSPETGAKICSGSKTERVVSLCPEALHSSNDGQWDKNRVPTVGQIIGYFKYQSTKKINEIRHHGIQRIWQRNYYEHIVRDESDLNRICKYIQNNPLKWGMDKLHGI